METTKTDVKEPSRMVIRNKRISTPGRSAVLQMAVLLLVIAAVLPSRLKADVVTDWNQIMLETIANGKTSPVVSTRVTAIVEAAVVEGLIGNGGPYTPIHLDCCVPRGGSKPA